MVNKRKAAPAIDAASPPKEKRVSELKCTVERKERKSKNSNFKAYSDLQLVARPGNNMRSMSVIYPGALGWVEEKAGWRPAKATKNQFNVRKCKAKDPDDPEKTVNGVSIDLTLQHSKYDGSMDALGQDFHKLTGVPLKILGEVPTVDFDISEVFDEEDDVALVSIKCDEPLATAAGFDFKKLETGFDAGFVFMSRDGDITTFGATVDTEKLEDYSTQDAIEKMTKVTRKGKKITNPNVRFEVVIKIIEVEK